MKDYQRYSDSHGYKEEVSVLMQSVLRGPLASIIGRSHPVESCGPCLDSEKTYVKNTVASRLYFVIVVQLWFKGSKNSSPKLQINYTINYFFTYI